VVNVPPTVKVRWFERLRALGDELAPKGDGSTEPTHHQLDIALRELVAAEADVQGTAAPAEALAVVPIAVRIFDASPHPPDNDGHTTLQREARLTLLGSLEAGHDGQNGTHR
jgi:hypothetical protein